MNIVAMLLILAALILFLLDTFGAVIGSIKLTPFGLACLTLYLMLTHLSLVQ